MRPELLQRLVLTLAAAALCFMDVTHSFYVSIPQEVRWDRLLHSSIGDGGDRPPSDNDSPRGRQSWEDFLNRDGSNESENLVRAREYMSDNRLPISYDYNSKNGKDVKKNGTEPKDPSQTAATSSALVAQNNNGGALSDPFTAGELTPELLQNNPYLAVVLQLSPSEIISKFTTAAPPGVQNAVRSTILGLIGGLPKLAFETTTVTTGQKLASLMFQLQMTGYMFKVKENRLLLCDYIHMMKKTILCMDSRRRCTVLQNAEYRLSLRQSLDDQFLESATAAGKIRGKLRVRYGGAMDAALPGLEMEVDAAAYMSELRSEVAKLRDELMIARKEKDDVVRKDLLAYIRTLPPQELQSLTNTMSQDVLVAMKGLVNAVIAGIGEGQIGPDTITEQSGEAMAQLCMWQLALGYNLRTLEVREEMRRALSGGSAGVDRLPDALE